MLTVSGLYIYPVKSLSGIAVDTAIVTSRGLQYDRRLALADSGNRIITQRNFPAMALLQPVLANNGLYIHHKKNTLTPLFIPYEPAENETLEVTVWDDTCEARVFDAGINEWFSRALDLPARLVYMPDSTSRKVDEKYARNNEITSFADGYPMLIVGQSSLDDLNKRLADPLPMNRFRPNIVFTGGDAFVEDRIWAFTINEINFNGVKPCARCVMTTINQDTLLTSKEPLKTLATYRLKNNAILFGQNLLHRGTGTISTGDTIHVTAWQQAPV